jgi:hypothetical protein
MSTPLPPLGLEVARRLSADGRWQESSDAFARLDAGGGLDADGLAEFAVVSWMAGDFGACLELYGRSYRGTSTVGTKPLRPWWHSRSPGSTRAEGRRLRAPDGPVGR